MTAAARASVGAAVEPGGWWSGVLHPVESEYLALMLVVAVLAGVAATQGRSARVGPLAFMAGTFAGIVGARAGIRVPFLDAALAAGLVVGAALVFVAPPRTSRVLPLAAVLAGSLHGLSWHVADAAAAGAGATQPAGVAHLLGFVFTTLVLQAFGAIAGVAVGRSSVARRAVAVGAVAATVVLVAG
jgi:hydrogenase/urease accessory protein HupE